MVSVTRTVETRSGGRFSPRVGDRLRGSSVTSKGRVYFRVPRFFRLRVVDAPVPNPDDWKGHRHFIDFLPALNHGIGASFTPAAKRIRAATAAPYPRRALAVHPHIHRFLVPHTRGEWFVLARLGQTPPVLDGRSAVQRRETSLKTGDSPWWRMELSEKENRAQHSRHDFIPQAKSHPARSRK